MPKKTIVFLFLMTIVGNTFGMEEIPEKTLVIDMRPLLPWLKIPKIELTQKRSAVIAAALPLTVAAGIYCKDDIAAMLPKISLPDQQLVGIAGTVVAMPLTYIGLQRFTLEERATKYAISEKSQEYKMLEDIVSVAFKSENRDNVPEIIGNKFSDEAHKGHLTTIKGLEEIDRLRFLAEEQESILKRVQLNGFEQIQYNYPPESETETNTMNIESELKKIGILKEKIEKVRGKIDSSRQGMKEKKLNVAMRLQEQKMSLFNKISALGSLLAAPAIGNLITVFFQWCIAIFGSKKELPFQGEVAPSVVFVDSTIYQAQPQT